MCEIFSEVRAILSSSVVSAIEGCVLDTIRQCVVTATVQPISADNTIQYHLHGTLEGIVQAKGKIEELLNNIHIKKVAKESHELDSTTLSEENSSCADEGNTSYDKEGTDKTSCLSDDKEQETNASSNGYISTDKASAPSPRNKTSKKMRLVLKERPRMSQRLRSARLTQLRTLKKFPVRNKSLVGRYQDPDNLSENLQQMKLATEESDLDSAGPVSKIKKPARLPCKLLNCSYCSYQTTKQHYFERHQRIHCSKRSFIHQCEHCCYRTHRKEHLQRHINNVHKNQRSYLCHICGKAFKRSDALQQHHQVHSLTPLENTNFKCTVCNKQFRSQSHLYEHKAVHSEERTFLCEICGASFKTRSVHRKHVQSIHRNPRAFSCDMCTKKFNTLYVLKRHRKTHSVKSTFSEVTLTEETDNASTNETESSTTPLNPYSLPAASGTEMVSNVPANFPEVAPIPMVVPGSDVLSVNPPVLKTTEAATILYLANSVAQL